MLDQVYLSYLRLNWWTEKLNLAFSLLCFYFHVFFLKGLSRKGIWAKTRIPFMHVCCQWCFLLSCNRSNIQKIQPTTKHTNKNGLWGVKLGCTKWEEITPPLYHIILPSLFLLSVWRLFLTKLPKLVMSPLNTYTSLGFIIISPLPPESLRLQACVSRFA